MTNEEFAIERIGCEGRSNCAKCGGRLSIEKGCSEFQNIMAMAQWKDEQFAKQKQAIIDKACEILKIRLIGDCMSKESFHYFITKFRKAIEETK